ncbi:MAG: hypothetical protein HDS84_08165 [Bacteroidales bacterium]|nr:hypothetical protein [Bacteroidales bacterium]MBD5349072.1 hypothetical protein [Bacteroides sp.]
MRKFLTMLVGVLLASSLTNAASLQPRSNNFTLGSKLQRKCITNSSSLPKNFTDNFKVTHLSSITNESIPKSDVSVSSLPKANRIGSEDPCLVNFNVTNLDGYHLLGIGFAASNAEYWEVLEEVDQVEMLPGVYDFVLICEANEEGNPFKILVKENIEISTNITLQMNINECTELIKFEPVLPDGRKVVGETCNANLEIIQEGNVTANSYIYSAFGNKRLGTIFRSETGFGTMETPTGAIEWARKGDFFVNPGVSENYQCGQVSIVITNDNAHDPLVIFNQAETLTAQTISNNTDYTYTSYDRQFTSEFYGLESDFKGYRNFFLVNVIEAGIPSYFISGNGPECSHASRIGLNSSSMVDNGYMHISMQLNKEIVGETEVIDNVFESTICYQINPSIFGSIDGKLKTFVMPPSENLQNMEAFISSDGQIDTGLLLNGNPYFSFFQDQSEEVACDNVPFLYFSDMCQPHNGSEPATFSSFYTCLGRLGETPTSCSGAVYRLSYDNNTYEVSEDFPSLYTERKLREYFSQLDNALADNYTGKVNFEIERKGMITIDDIPGISKINAEWKSLGESDDVNVPSLTMLQFRNVNDIVTDRFENASDGVIMFTVADFKPELKIEFDEDGNFVDFYRYLSYTGCPQVFVEYAPIGSDDWTEIEVVEDPDKFYLPGFGAYFSGSLSGVDKVSPNGWMKLRISLTDSYENKLVTEIAPAFHVSSLSGIDEINPESTELIYRIEGRSIMAPKGTEVYNTDGVKVNPENLTPGIYILRNGALSAKCLLK